MVSITSGQARDTVEGFFSGFYDLPGGYADTCGVDSTPVASSFRKGIQTLVLTPGPEAFVPASGYFYDGMVQFVSFYGHCPQAMAVYEEVQRLFTQFPTKAAFMAEMAIVLLDEAHLLMALVF